MPKRQVTEGWWHALIYGGGGYGFVTIDAGFFIYHSEPTGGGFPETT